jgi:hypothetical protein
LCRRRPGACPAAAFSLSTSELREKTGPQEQPVGQFSADYTSTLVGMPATSSPRHSF